MSDLARSTPRRLTSDTRLVPVPSHVHVDIRLMIQMQHNPAASRAGWQVLQESFAWARPLRTTITRSRDWFLRHGVPTLVRAIHDSHQPGFRALRTAWLLIPAPSRPFLQLISQRGRLDPRDVDCSKAARDAVAPRQRQTRWAQKAYRTRGQGLRCLAFRLWHCSKITSSILPALFNARQSQHAFSFAFAESWVLHHHQKRGYNSRMKSPFEKTLISVWRQALVDEADAVKLGSARYPVTRSKTKRLRQVAFGLDGNMIIGIEQNPKTKSRWAAMARTGKAVMQFIRDGRYIAVVADGKVILYG
jgi:hypothetical protein